jgi:hypothetical protein
MPPRRTKDKEHFSSVLMVGSTQDEITLAGFAAFYKQPGRVNAHPWAVA